MDYLILLIAGVFGGVVAGMLGVGGGIIYILILPFFLKSSNVSDSELVAHIISNSIFAVMFVSISANIKKIIKKEFDYKIVFMVGITGAISSIFAMEYIVRSPWYSKVQFSSVIIFFMILMLYRLFSKGDLKAKTNNNLFYILIGLFAGLTSALSGLGGGVIIVPLIMYIFGKEIHYSKSISLGAIGIMAIFLTIKNMSSQVESDTQYALGYIVFPVALSLSTGVLLGTPIGVIISKKLSEKWLKILFSLMLIIVIVKKIIEIASELEWL